MDVPILVVLFDVLNVRVFIVNWIQVLLKERLVIPNRFTDWNLSDADSVIFNLKYPPYNIRVRLVHDDLPFVPLPSNLDNTWLVSNSFPDHSNNIIHFVRIYRGAPTRPYALTAIYQDHRQNWNIVFWLNAHILFLQILNHMIISLIVQVPGQRIQICKDISCRCMIFSVHVPCTKLTDGL